MILFIALPEAEGKIDPGLITFPLELLPRQCPLCGNWTIIPQADYTGQSSPIFED